MPYTRAELLTAVRTDHPEFKGVDDNKLFAAIAVDHPEIAKGISELQGGNPQGKITEPESHLGINSQASTFWDEAKRRYASNPLTNTAPGAQPMGFGNNWESAFFGGGAPSSISLPAGSMATRAEALVDAAANSPAAQVVRAGVNKVTTPTNMLMRANANRIAAAEAPPIVDSLDLTKPLSVLKTVDRATLTPRAVFQEQMAKWMAGGQPGSPVGLTFPETDFPPNPPQPAVLNQAQRRANIMPPVTVAPEIPASAPPVAIPRPEVPQFIQNTLERMRGEHVPMLETKPPAAPSEGIPFNPPETLMAPPPPNVKVIEQGIAPTGMRNKFSTMRIAQQLPEHAPEIVGVRPGPEFDAKLMDAFKRTEGTVIATENAVPSTATVTKQPILDKFKEIAQDYTERGLPNSAATVEKIAEKWKELPNEIPWDQFIKLKRSFFKEGGLNSAPLRRGYSALMDASGKISEDLAKANKSYSIVRRALEAGQMDLQTGRRIKSVGIADKFGFGRTQP